MKVNFLASQIHFLDHLAPLFCGLMGAPFCNDGVICLHPDIRAHAATLGIPRSRVRGLNQIPAGERMVVASIGDVKTIKPHVQGLALLEHGCGMSFSTKQSNHPGGGGARDAVDLFLMPNHWAADRDRAAHPDKRVEIVGAPKLDWVRDYPFHRNASPVIAWATHWDCHTCEETRSALSEYRSAIPQIAKEWKLIGHCHPRSEAAQWAIWQSYGVERVRILVDVMKRADLLIGDAGSAPYEFAATGKPVVLINRKRYRRTVQHGLRWWSDVPGIQVNRPEELFDAVQLALSDPPEVRAERERVVSVVYPNLGEALPRALEVLADWAADGTPVGVVEEVSHA